MFAKLFGGNPLWPGGNPLWSGGNLLLVRGKPPLVRGKPPLARGKYPLAQKLKCLCIPWQTYNVFVELCTKLLLLCENQQTYAKFCASQAQTHEVAQNPKNFIEFHWFSTLYRKQLEIQAA